MSVLKIQGGARLEGVVEVPGSKNSALSLLSAVVLADGIITLNNIPRIADVELKTRVLEAFGVRCQRDGTSLVIDTRGLRAGQPMDEEARSIRTSFFLLGPLLARLGEVMLPTPGGCQIGARPVDYHIKGLEKLGATVDLEAGYYRASSPELVGAEIYLDKPSPGATQHLMTTAVLAKGITTIQNAAMEPEVVTLAEFLNSMGARIEGLGTSTIVITGVKSLHGTTFRVPSDRIQAGTYLVAGAITRGDVTVQGLLPDTQAPLINKLREAGCEVTEDSESVRVRMDRQPEAVSLVTGPYPAFPTDMQQPMCAFLTLAHGVSEIEETIYEGRFGHVRELNKMGANVTVKKDIFRIIGVPRLQGTTVQATDLRGGAAMVLAGLAAEGETIIEQSGHIDRGYERLESTLTSLGASIQRVQGSTPSRGDRSTPV